MESPLDVLTRAASMVETNQINSISGDLKRSLDLSVTSESAPTKYKRVPVEQEPVSVQPRTYAGHVMHMSRLIAPLQAHHYQSSRMDADNCPLNLSVAPSYKQEANRPSVISMTNSTMRTSATSHHSVSNNTAGHGQQSFKDTPASAKNKMANLGKVGKCDPAIEEHFRRSLGEFYPNYMTKEVTTLPTYSPPVPEYSPPPPTYTPLRPVYSTPQTAPHQRRSPPPIKVEPVVISPIPDYSNGRSSDSTSPGSTAWSNVSPGSSCHDTESNDDVSVTGSVDDHFARALGGSTWNQIKHQNEAAPLEGSVDDHFAKALGETWFRIKAQKEKCANGMSRSTSSSPELPHHTPHTRMPLANT